MKMLVTSLFNYFVSCEISLEIEKENQYKKQEKNWKPSVICVHSEHQVPALLGVCFTLLLGCGIEFPQSMYFSSGIGQCTCVRHPDMVIKTPMCPYIVFHIRDLDFPHFYSFLSFPGSVFNISIQTGGPPQCQGLNLAFWRRQ